MSQSPPPEPPREREPLGFDDFIGILIALSSIGAILLWSFSQSERGFDLSLFQSLSPSPRPIASPTPTVEDRSTPIIPVPYNSPSPSPQPTIAATPQPSPTAPPVVPLPIPYQPAPSVETGFSDVPPGFWASPFITVLAQRRIIEGFPDRTFRPEHPVTRAEFANMLQKAFNRSENQQSLQFKDLRSGYWANPAIDQAVQMGFMKGYPGNIFRPNEEISRTESLVSLANGLNLPQSSSPERILSFYRDSGQIPRYAIEEMAAATEAGLVVNHPDAQILNPQQVTNRAEAAALIYQALVRSGQAERISSPYIVQP